MAEEKGLKDSLCALKEELATKEDQCLALQSDLDRLKIEWHRVESNLISNVEKYYNMMSKVRGQAEDLKLRLSQADVVEAELRGHNESLRKEIEEQQKEIRRLSVEIEHLSRSTEQENGLIEQLRAENSSLQKKLRKIGEYRLKDRHIAYEIMSTRHSALSEKDKEIQKIE